jgi:anchored repeat ABC transporter substrate-binding protein
MTGVRARRSTARRAVTGVLGATLALALVACTSPYESTSNDGRMSVVTTTGILADLARNVTGDLADVSSLVPETGDPHSYEPTPVDATRVSQADVTFTNHLLLEEQRLIKTIDANAPEGAPNISLAEAAESYGANVIPLVKDIGLDVLWLGLRVRGTGESYGATRTSDVVMRATDLRGPGELYAYLVQSLGAPEIYFGSGDGFDASDSTSLPPAAHTHLNWAFTEPGVYELTLESSVENADGDQVDVGEGTFTFAVGVNPRTAVPGKGRTVLDAGHTDVTVDLDTGEMYAYSDPEVGTNQVVVPASEAVIDVPNRALEEIPSDPRFRFLGEGGDQVHQLPQAVIGKHVHGEIDPHLWQDVDNARSYVQLMRDTFKDVDPDNASAYDANAAAYLDELDELDAYVAEQIGELRPADRQLITTHEAFAYLADAYGLTVAGFVVPNPAQEPSAEQVRTLSDTIRNLEVPAVFLEPSLAARASVLTQVASDQGVETCTIYGDAFDEVVTSYVEMMRHNADEVARCLGGAA